MQIKRIRKSTTQKIKIKHRTPVELCYYSVSTTTTSSSDEGSLFVWIHERCDLLGSPHLAQPIIHCLGNLYRTTWETKLVSKLLHDNSVISSFSISTVGGSQSLRQPPTTRRSALQNPNNGKLFRIMYHQWLVHNDYCGAFLYSDSWKHRITVYIYKSQ